MTKDNHQNTKRPEAKSGGEKASPKDGTAVPVVNSLGRIVLTFAIAGIAIYYRLQPLWKEDKNAMVLASWNSTIGTAGIAQIVPCLPDYKVEYKGCQPVQCGRYILDRLVTEEEAAKLIMIAEKGMKLGGGGAGGNTILDLHSGQVSQGTKYSDVMKLAEEAGITELFTYDDMKLYRTVKNRIQVELERKWKVGPGLLKLTNPTYVSRTTSKQAATMDDEYWHVHVDNEQHESYHFTTVLYLNTYRTDFKGGRFMFDTPGYNHTVHPRVGRVSMFTSGSEHPHHVERVTSGARYALTVPFTCAPDSAVADPDL